MHNVHVQGCIYIYLYVVFNYLLRHSAVCKYNEICTCSYWSGAKFFGVRQTDVDTSIPHRWKYYLTINMYSQHHPLSYGLKIDHVIHVEIHKTL